MSIKSLAFQLENGQGEIESTYHCGITYEELYNVDLWLYINGYGKDLELMYRVKEVLLVPEKPKQERLVFINDVTGLKVIVTLVDVKWSNT